MTLFNCIEFAAECLNLEQIAESIRDTSVVLAPHERREFDILTHSAKAVIDEIGREYTPLIGTDRINVLANQRRILFSALPRTVVEILEVRHLNREVRFTRYADRIELESAGWHYVRYSYAPRAAQLTTRLEWENGRISIRLIAFGICAEYCMRNGMMDEAVMWDRRYKDALLAAMRVKREHRIPARRFK